MEKRVNGIIPTKESQGTKCKGKAKYTKIIEYFENLSASIGKYNKLFTGGERGKHYYIQTEKFNEIFYNDSFNFLDILYLFVCCGSSQKIGVLNFLLSDETEYGAKEKIYTYTINFDNLNKDLKEYEEYTIRKRRLFTLAVLSLIQDYFNTYEVDKKTKEIQENLNLSDNEIILEFMFKSIFNNKKRLLNIFKKTKIIKLGIKIEFYIYIKNVVIIKTDKAKINNQINGIKQQILNYFNFCYNSKEQNENLVKDFLNICTTEIVSQQIESEQQKSDFLQQERERLSCFKPTEMNYEIINSYDKQTQNHFSSKSQQPINYQINFNTIYTTRYNQYSQNTFMTTFQQNQQTLQNLDEAMEMFGNEHGFGQWF